MTYRLKIGEQVTTVETQAAKDDGWTDITLGEKALKARFEAVSNHQLQLELETGNLNLFVAQMPEGTWVECGGRSRLVMDADKAEQRKARRRGPGQDSNLVTPPTPATVIRLMAEVGQEVEKGQPLVVVSAMKMETTLAAPYEGVVKAINTEAGARVSPGDILVEITPSAGEAPPE